MCDGIQKCPTVSLFFFLSLCLSLCICYASWMLLNARATQISSSIVSATYFGKKPHAQSYGKLNSVNNAEEKARDVPTYSYGLRFPLNSSNETSIPFKMISQFARRSRSLSPHTIFTPRHESDSGKISNRMKRTETALCPQKLRAKSKHYMPQIPFPKVHLSVERNPQNAQTQRPSVPSQNCAIKERTLLKTTKQPLAA